MSEELTIRHGSVVLFSLKEGRHPREYADKIVERSYDLGNNVIHMGTVAALGRFPDGAMGLGLEDGTDVAMDDVDLNTFHVLPEEMGR